MTLSIESKGEVIPCHKQANTALATCCKVAVLEDLEIPPRCELMVPGATMGGIVPSTGVIEPTQLFVQRKGLLVAKFSIDTNKKVIPLRVINLLYEHCKLYQAKIVQTCENVEAESIVTTCSEQVNRVSQEDTRNCDKKVIPEHLQELFKQSCIHLSPQEQEQIREFLWPYQHLFSKNTSDSGCTTLVHVEHQINTVNSRPVKQRRSKYSTCKNERRRARD